MNGDGTAALVNGVLHAWTGAGWEPRGEAPGPLNAPGVLSPGGTRVYRVVRNEDIFLGPAAIAVFDAQAAATGGALQPLGEIPIPVLVADCRGGGYGCNFDPVLLVAPFGDTLFLLGNQRVVVLPIPLELQGGG